jgi:hypothetical protein
MSTTHDTNDEGSTDDELPAVVQRFRETFPSSYREGRIHDTEWRGSQVDGKGWTNGDDTVALFDPDCTFFGYVELGDLTPAEYIDTRSVCDRRAYTFTAGDDVQAIDVQFLRDAANEVFDVSYDTMKANAYTIDDPNIRGCLEGISPVVFDLPNEQYRLMIAPLNSEELRGA